MLLQFALVLAMLLQIFAAGVSIKLTRVTKYNVSWMLISAGFIMMAIRCLVEFLPTISGFAPQTFREVFVWLGVAVSFSFAVGVFLIQKIFKYMKKVEQEKRDMEKTLLNAIIQAEETERKRFAKDLHDGLGPILSTIKMSLSSLSRVDKEDQTKKILRNTDMVIDEAIKSFDYLVQKNPEGMKYIDVGLTQGDTYATELSHLKDMYDSYLVQFKNLGVIKL